MNEKKKVLFNQIVEINKRIENLKQERNSLIEQMRNTNSGITFGKEFSDIPDYSLKDEEIKVNNEIAELEKLLADAEVVVEYDENVINIGTRFAATVAYNDDEIETEEYILSSTKEGSPSERKRKPTDPLYVTPESPFGSAVMGKKKGEGFYYVSDNQMIVGYIEDIITKEEMEKGNQKTK